MTALFVFLDASLCDHLHLFFKKPHLQIGHPQALVIRSVCE